MKKWLIIAGLMVLIGGVTYWLLTRDKDVSGGLGITQKDAVCIVDGVALKDSPGKEGVFVGTINLGEKLTIIDKKEVETSKGTKVYFQVELKGGEKGWVKETSIIVAARPAAIAEDATVYKRPDLITQTSKTFSPLDIIAVTKKQGDFIEVYGKTKDGKKVKGGWIKSSDISFEEVDVAVAIYVAKANKKAGNDARLAALKEIAENPDFSSSRFIGELTALTTESAPAPLQATSEEPDSTMAD